MGYLTPILFRNDSASTIRDNPDQVANAIYFAMNNEKGSHYPIYSYAPRKWWQFWRDPKRTTGVNVNPIEALGTRHADQTSVILFHGNGWIDLSEFIYKKNWGSMTIDQLEKYVKISQEHLTQIKRVIKERKTRLFYN